MDIGAWQATIHGVAKSQTEDESESGEWKSWLKAQHSENEDNDTLLRNKQEINFICLTMKS